MKLLFDNYSTIILYIGILDAGFVLLIGMISAILWLFDIKAEKFFERVIPAVGVLIGTSIAAGLIMFITRYIALHI